MRKRFRPLLEEESVDEPLINLTPLIDVVFVVLITFMLIAPVLDIDPVDLALGSPAKKETSNFQASPISIAVHADNSIWIQQTRLTMAQLETKLRQEKKKYPRAVPQVVHDSKASFGTYQTIKNALEAAGFEQMDVILKPN